MSDDDEPARTWGSLPETRRGLPRLWLFDTSALVTMAAHRDLHDAVTGYLDEQRCSSTLTITAELTGLVRGVPPTSAWARSALADLGWLVSVVDAPQEPVLVTAAKVQADMLAAAPSGAPHAHWGESVLIALATYLENIDATIVIDDYDARLCAQRWGIDAISVTRLVWHMTCDGYRSAQQAADYTAALVRCRRWTNQRALTEEEFTAGRLGKHGRPAGRR